MDRIEQKLLVIGRFARDVAMLSTCKAKHVGVVAFPADFSEITAIGYNGPPSGSPNDACTAPHTQDVELARCGCIHGEANAIGKGARGIMYCTTCPCPHCAGIVANSRRIRLVLWEAPYSTEAGLDTLYRAGISCVKMTASNGMAKAVEHIERLRKETRDAR